MKEYDKLVKALRWCADEAICCDDLNGEKCPYYDVLDSCTTDAVLHDAADAIEALLKENQELIEDHPEMVEADGHWEWRKPNGEVLLPKRGEIVRCGECKYSSKPDTNGEIWCKREDHGEDLMECHGVGWFCADGEREVQDGTD